MFKLFVSQQFTNRMTCCAKTILSSRLRELCCNISCFSYLPLFTLQRSSKRERIPTRSLSTKRLKKFVYRRKWQKAVNAMLALKRMGVKLQ